MTPQIKKLLHYIQRMLAEELETAEQEIQCKQLLFDAILRELEDN